MKSVILSTISWLYQTIAVTPVLLLKSREREGYKGGERELIELQKQLKKGKRDRQDAETGLDEQLKQYSKGTRVCIT